MLLSILILSEVGGWVLLRSLAFNPGLCNGLIIYIGAVTRLADLSTLVDEEIFSNAEANPSGYLV